MLERGDCKILIWGAAWILFEKTIKIIAKAIAITDDGAISIWVHVCAVDEIERFLKHSCCIELHFSLRLEEYTVRSESHLVDSHEANSEFSDKFFIRFRYLEKACSHSRDVSTAPEPFYLCTD